MADAYEQFSSSPDGQIQHQLLWNALKPHLETLDSDSAVLDAGCGDGWLTQMLLGKFEEAIGIDASGDLIAAAQKNYPKISFTVADLTEPLPFEDNQFEIAILNMVLHNIPDQPRALNNLRKVLKADSNLFVIMPNPYYTFPAAVWKHGLGRWLLRRNPWLRLQNYGKQLIRREFQWKNSEQKKISGRFSPLPEQINNLLTAGFQLEQIEEIMSEADSQLFDLRYRAHRFPIFLLLTLKKLR
jgi:ubiquinone/menaquinone biosynthesis C-methylase UbiE